MDYDTQQLGLGLDILQFEDQQPLTLEACRRIVALGQHILIDTPTAPLAAVMYELVYIEILRPDLASVQNFSVIIAQPHIEPAPRRL